MNRTLSGYLVTIIKRACFGIERGSWPLVEPCCLKMIDQPQQFFTLFTQSLPLVDLNIISLIPFSRYGFDDGQKTVGFSIVSNTCIDKTNYRLTVRLMVVLGMNSWQWHSAKLQRFPNTNKYQQVMVHAKVTITNTRNILCQTLAFDSLVLTIDRATPSQEWIRAIAVRSQAQRERREVV